MKKQVMSRQAKIDSRIIQYHLNRLNEIEDALLKCTGRELSFLESSRRYHISRMQSKWDGKKYSVPVV